MTTPVPSPEAVDLGARDEGPGVYGPWPVTPPPPEAQDLTLPDLCGGPPEHLIAWRRWAAETSDLTPEQRARAQGGA